MRSNRSMHRSRGSRARTLAPERRRGPLAPFPAMPTSVVTRRRRLEALRKEIMASIPNPWLFPAQGGVQGFMGVARVMFVAERPSTGHFGGHADRLLYALLKKCRVADSHLTDAIKSRGKVGEPYPDDMASHRRIFDREIEIVGPRLIIAFGQKVYDLLQFALAGSGIRIRQVWHYSYARRGREKAAAFEKQLREALER